MSTLAAILISTAAADIPASPPDDIELYGDWTRSDPPAWVDFSSIVFSGDGTGWLYSPQNGVLYRTDAAIQWVQHEKLGGNWRLIHDGEKLPLFLVGPQGEIRIYQEHQLNWVPVFHGGPEIEIRDVAALPLAELKGGNYGWTRFTLIAVGSQRCDGATKPYLIALQPPARGWREISLNAEKPAEAVTVRNPFSANDRGVFVAADSALFISDDEGITFNRANLPAYQEDVLRDVVFFDSDRGWAVGDDGALLWTQTGGQQWFKEPRDTRDDFTGVTVLGWSVFLFDDDHRRRGHLWTMNVRQERPVITEFPFNDVPRAVALDGHGRRWLVGDRGLIYIQSKLENPEGKPWEPLRIFPDR